MSETRCRLRGNYPEPQGSDLRGIVDELNRWGAVKEMTVAGGATVAVAHGCDKIPSVALQVITKDVTGSGTVVPGTGTWDSVYAYLTATSDGDYAVIFRR